MLFSRTKAANVQAILYTSPSHTPQAPRWRVLFPFSTPLLPAERSKYADRANAILGGALAKETWTLSQAFYYGATSSNTDFQIVALPSTTTIDQLPDTAEEQPYVKPKGSSASAANKAPKPDLIEDLPNRLKRVIKSGDPKKFGFGTDRSPLVFYVACELIRLGWSDERIAELLTDSELPISAHVRDQGNPAAYAKKQVRDARAKVDVDWVYGREGILPDNQKTSRALWIP